MTGTCPLLLVIANRNLGGQLMQNVDGIGMVGYRGEESVVGGREVDGWRGTLWSKGSG